MENKKQKDVRSHSSDCRTLGFSVILGISGSSLLASEWSADLVAVTKELSPRQE